MTRALLTVLATCLALSVLTGACRVPHGPAVDCQHGTCVKGVNLARSRIDGGLDMFENAEYCKCEWPYTGIACEKLCPADGGKPCRDMHIQPEQGPTEGCGQVYHREPDWSAYAAGERSRLRSAFLASNGTFARPGTCLCPWPTFGEACEFAADKSRMTRQPTMADMIAAGGMVGGPWNPSQPLAFQYVGQGSVPAPYSICGPHGQLGPQGCTCGAGTYQPFSPPLPLTTIPGRRDSHMWAMSSVPYCVRDPQFSGDPIVQQPPIGLPISGNPPPQWVPPPPPPQRWPQPIPVQTQPGPSPGPPPPPSRTPPVASGNPLSDRDRVMEKAAEISQASQTAFWVLIALIIVLCLFLCGVCAWVAFAIYKRKRDRYRGYNPVPRSV